MPFIPPLIGASLIGAGGSIGASLLGKGGGGGGSTGAEGKQIQDLLGLIEDRSRQQSRMGKKDWRAFHHALDPVSEWFQGLLTGDRTKLMEVLGPEVAATGRQYDAVSKAIGEFSPRGGGRTAALSQTEFAKARDVGELFSKARPMAAQGLEQVASLFGSQAGTEGGLGMSGLTSALSGLLGLRGQDIERMLTNRQFAGDLGRSLGSILAQVLGRFGGGSAGGSGGKSSSSPLPEGFG